VNQEQIGESIAAGAARMQQELPLAAAGKLAHLLTELARWGRRVNLTAILEPDEMISAHVLDSLSVRPLLEGTQVVDIGTGAGFPGLPLALAEPQLNFTLLDSNGKKISFVRHMIAELDISNVVAVKSRAEDYAPVDRFDTVIARALTSASGLLQMAGHLVREDGVLLALKGKHPAAELEAISNVPEWDYTVTELQVPGLEAHARHVVSLRRNGSIDT
jgi:16S rRNA (guanine527-N7)-methyltransferase